MTGPAVYRNPRYERQIVQLAIALAQLSDALAAQAGLVRMQGDLIEQLIRATSVEHLIPPLPEVKDRGFGMGH